MKPIKLIVKGLNSFKEEQVIDFNVLTDRGLFGIFGPTGSGKSTILDGITLALFGKTSRDSSNFINTQCDELSIRYEFQIRDVATKHYIIDRTFKRNKDGRINAKKPTRIIEILEGTENVLEEATTAVDKRCVDIIGLKFEDFIRTVVLPQGKFSDFLKLEGKRRREMLERLFSLDKYGDGLARKLGSAIKKEKSEMDVLTGELKGFEDISEDAYTSKSNELELISSQEVNVNKELELINKDYLNAESLWNLHQELLKHKKEEDSLISQKQIIDKYKHQVEKGESCLKVKPYIDAVESTLKDISETVKSLLKENTLFETLKTDKKKIDDTFIEVRNKKDTEIPKLRVSENNVNEAIKEAEVKEKLAAELITLRNSYKKLKTSEKAQDELIKKLDVEIESLYKTITLSEEKIESIRIDEGYRNNIQSGLILQEKLEEKNKRKVQLEKEVKEACSKIDELKKNLEEKKALIEESNKVISMKENQLSEIINNCPGDSTLLLEMQKNISNIKITIEKGSNFKKELDILNNEVKNVTEQMNSLKLSKDFLENEVKELKKVIEDERRESIAQVLRAELKEGTECPVCGSKEHIFIDEKKVDLQELNNKEKILDDKQKELRSIENQWLSNDVLLKNKIDRVALLEEELNKLTGEWATINIESLNEEFNIKKLSIEKWISEKENSEKQLKELKDKLNITTIEQSKVQSSFDENTKGYKKYAEELQIITAEYNDILSKFNELKNILEVEDFIKRDKEIKLLDKEKQALEKLIKTYREDAKLKEVTRDNHQKTLNNYIDEIATTRVQGEEKSKQVKEKEDSIKNKVGENSDLLSYKTEILNQIEKIEKDFIKIEKEKTIIEEKYSECDKNIKAYELQLKNSKARIEKDKENLEEILKSEGFNSREEAQNFFIAPDKIKELKALITEYENNINQTKGKIKDVLGKIANREITENQWLEIQRIKSEKEKELVEIRNNLIKVQTELAFIKEKLEQLKDLLNKKEKLEHKLSLLNDLDNLFKGKKFVEFVATHQLKYVSLEASKRLREISNGSYGLEVDEDGKFIIRDYKNGGATRDASTLSGGETFLASLALALALSAQIQLKGTAPLELFFLDEGFGTLDDNLLEIVMSSLERIHNDKLSVGIISHVESIKNRVPVKLLISPAQAGVGGSKVKIERT